ncbi:hypothetical protein F5Y19DRAFT_414431 [Xylariaceae sp. FL1651]|nr:hypothetical protein F5Y19DRAFT_414431 [Xylariaceae sp. FL1651]
MSIRTLLSSVRAFYVDLTTGLPSQDSPRTHLPDINVSVGSYELTGETKKEVLELSLRGVLRSTGLALRSLSERVSRWRQAPFAHHPESLGSGSINSTQLALDFHNFDHTTLEAEDIERLIQMLQKIMHAISEDLTIH